MIRNVAAGVAGIVTAYMTIMLVDMLGHTIYPPPLGLDFSDAGLPIGAFLFIMASPVTAGFTGTMVACYVGTTKPIFLATVVGGIVLAASIANFIFIPHPLWLSIATLIGIVASAWLAMLLATKPSVQD